MSDSTFGGRPIHLNVAAGLIVQVVNYLFPLALLPYLARVLGVATFGNYVVAIGIVTYASIMVEWGFALGAGKQVARSRLDPSALRAVFWDVSLARLLLAVLTSACIVAAAACLEDRQLAALILAGMANILGVALSPDWYLIGLERGVRLSLATVVGRTAQLVFTILLVRSADGAALAVGIWGATTLLTSVIALAMTRQLIPPGRPQLGFVRSVRAILANRHYFLVKSAVLLYAGSGPVILSAVAGPAAAGIYGGADRLSRAGLSFIGQFSSVMAPRINALAAHAPDAMTAFVRRAAILQIGLALVGSVFLLVAAGPIVRIMLGPGFDGSIQVLRLLAMLPVLAVIGGTLGVQMMVPLHLERSLVVITLIGLVIFVATAIPLSYWLGADGAAIAILVTELAVIVGEVTELSRKRPKQWRALWGLPPAAEVEAYRPS